MADQQPDDSLKEEEEAAHEIDEAQLMEEIAAVRYDEFYELSVALYLRMLADTEAEYFADRRQQFKTKASMAIEASIAFFEALEEHEEDLPMPNHVVFSDVEEE